MAKSKGKSRLSPQQIAAIKYQTGEYKKGSKVAGKTFGGTKSKSKSAKNKKFKEVLSKVGSKNKKTKTTKESKLHIKKATGRRKRPAFGKKKGSASTLKLLRTFYQNLGGGKGISTIKPFQPVSGKESYKISGEKRYASLKGKPTGR